MEHDFLQLEKKLAATHTDLRFLQQKYNDSVDFQKSLKEAKITTRLQHPRLAARQEKNKMSIPERYQYVRSLAQNGMSADLIASVLSISTREAEQLVQLSKIADDSM